jgi:hypothetical protein
VVRRLRKERPGWVDHRWMVIDMDESQIRTLDQVRAFLDGTLAVEFKPLAEDAARYRHIHNVLWRFDYHKLKRTQRGWVLQYQSYPTRFEPGRAICVIPTRYEPGGGGSAAP